MFQVYDMASILLPQKSFVCNCFKNLVLCVFRTFYFVIIALEIVVVHQLINDFLVYAFFITYIKDCSDSSLTFVYKRVEFVVIMSTAFIRLLTFALLAGQQQQVRKFSTVLCVFADLPCILLMTCSIAQVMMMMVVVVGL